MNYIDHIYSPLGISWITLIVYILHYIMNYIDRIYSPLDHELH